MMRRNIIDLAAWSTADTLMRMGLRPPLVESLTGLALRDLRDMWRDIYGAGAPNGRLPDCAGNVIRRQRDVLHANTFFWIYRRLGGKRVYATLDTNLLIKAYKEYRDYVGEDEVSITFEGAYFIARDIRARDIKVVRCTESNHIHYLNDLRHPHLTGCPICKMEKVNIGKPQIAPHKSPKSPKSSGPTLVRERRHCRTDIDMWKLAEDLTRAGLRPPQVQSCTGLGVRDLRNLWFDVHNHGSPNGQSPHNSLSIVRSYRQSIHANVFAGYYEMLCGDQMMVTLDPRKVLDAWAMFLDFVGGLQNSFIDFEVAWYVAHDLRSLILQRRECGKGVDHHIPHLVSVDGKSTFDSCPWCRLEQVRLGVDNEKRVKQPSEEKKAV